MKEGFVAKQQLDLLPERIRKAQETKATNDLYFWISDLRKAKNWKPMRIMVVGTGGSYPAALLARFALADQYGTPYVYAETPQNAIKTMREFHNVNLGEMMPDFDLVVGISYSGKTPDIKEVADFAERRGFPFVLLTGAKKSDIEDLYHESDSLKIISYFNEEDTTGMEESFISLFPVLAPGIVTWDNPTNHCISGIQEMLEDGRKEASKLKIASIARSLKKCPIIHIFYEWDMLPAAKDLESKFTESGIANVILHEKKDFSHGRCTIMCRQNFSVIINLNRYNIGIPLDGRRKISKYHKNEYNEKLAEFLKEICEEKGAHYLEFGNGMWETYDCNINMMAIFPYIITAIGEKMNIDIGKPIKPYPKKANYLYTYRGEFF